MNKSVHSSQGTTLVYHLARNYVVYPREWDYILSTEGHGLRPTLPSVDICVFLWQLRFCIGRFLWCLCFEQILVE